MRASAAVPAVTHRSPRASPRARPAHTIMLTMLLQVHALRGGNSLPVGERCGYGMDGVYHIGDVGGVYDVPLDRERNARREQAAIRLRRRTAVPGGEIRIHAEREL